MLILLSVSYTHLDVYKRQIYMQNTPQITTANAILTLQNEKGKTTKQDLRITVYEWQKMCIRDR